MNGVTGPYAKQILSILSPTAKVINSVPLPDFGGIHPDPNLTYAKELVDMTWNDGWGIGCASDGDGDRNMIVACDNVFVNPSDSIAGMFVLTKLLLLMLLKFHTFKRIRFKVLLVLCLLQQL